MKKIILMLVIFGLVLSPVSYAEYEETTVSASSYAEHMINLGLLSGMEGFEFTPYPVTRGEFANVVKNLLGFSFGKQALFSDVSNNTPYYEGIMTCAEYKIMNGYGDGTFRPDELITYKEAYKIFVSMLEYETIAEYEGGYPLGYYTVAKRLGLTASSEGVSYNSYITKEALPKLIFELLLAHCNDVVALKENTVSFLPSDETFAERYLKLEFSKGVISADEFGSIETENASVSDDKIRINGISFAYAHSFKDRLLGRYAEVFYDAENGNSVKSIAFPENYNKELDITADKLTLKSNFELCYKVGEEELKIKIPSDIIYVLNGEPVLYHDLSDITDENIILTDNDRDGRYDIIKIEKYDFYAVSYVYGNSVLYDQSGKTLSLKSDNVKDVIITDNEGNTLSVGDIQKDMSLSVVETSKNLIVIADKNNVSGKITSVEKGDINSVSVDDKDYPVNPNLSLTGLSLNEYKKAFIDIFGRVFLFINSEYGDANYAYIINGAYESVPEFSFILKIMKDTGEIVTLPVSENFYFNGSYKTPASVSDIPGALYDGNNFLRTLIRYTLNKDGELFKIDLPSENPETGFFKAATANAGYTLNSRTIGGNIVVDDSTKIFVVPESDSKRNDEDYFMMTRSNLNTMQAYNAEAYQTGERLTSDIIVLKGDYRGISYETSLGVFLRAVNGISKDGTYGEKICYYDGTEEKSAFVDYSRFPKAKALNKGDVVRVSLVNGEVSGFEYVYDFKNTLWKLSANPTSNSFESSNRISMGYIAAYDGEVMRLSYNEDFYGESVYGMEAYRTVSFNIIVVEKDGERILIRAGNESDIRPHDKAVIMLRSGSGRNLIIYKTK